MASPGTDPTDALTAPAATVGEVSDRIGAAVDTVSTPRYAIGEVADLSHSSRGHAYFDLTDSQSDATVDCVVFNARRRSISLPSGGTRDAVDGRVNFYPPRGAISIVVEGVVTLGDGSRERQRAEPEAALEEEGLLDPAARTALPTLPATIGIVTAPFGSALEDFRETLRDRYPAVDLYLAPTAVQGDRALETLVGAIQTLDSYPAVDVIVVTRGGGSDDSLWVFNEEPVVRTVARTDTPTCVAIGHEDDTVLAGRVADERVRTPTGAAESVVPAHDRLADRVTTLEHRLETATDRHTADRIATLDTDLDAAYTAVVEDRLGPIETRLDGAARHNAVQTPRPVPPAT